MRTTAAAEAEAVEKPAKTRTPAKRPAAKAAAPRKRANPPARTKPPEPAPPLPEPPVPAARRRSLLRLVGSAVIVLTALVAGAAPFVAAHWDRSPDQVPLGTADEVSTQELASFADTHGSAVYWAGDPAARTLELTRAAAGVFVRYLPAGVDIGSAERTLTIATYPLPNAYKTAVSRAKQAGMTSRTIRNGGLAVWSKAQPTSIYVAFRGVPSLVEVYAPAATETRSVALSGRVRPVR